MTVTSLPGWGIEDANQPWSLTAPDSSTLRFELRAGDHWAIDYNNAIEQRTEINDQNLIPPNTPISISYDMTIESGVNTSGFMAIGQMHSVSEGSPPFFVKLLPGNYMVIVAEYGNGTQNRTGSGPGGEADVYADKNPLIQGHTYHMQIDMKLSNDSTGYLHVWRDGVEIVNINGPIGYGDNTYWKEGIYRDNSPETMVIDYSHTTITTPAGTTTLVVPANEIDTSTGTSTSTGGTSTSAGDPGTGTGTGTSSGGTKHRHWHKHRRHRHRQAPAAQAPAQAPVTRAPARYGYGHRTAQAQAAIRQAPARAEVRVPARAEVRAPARAEVRAPARAEVRRTGATAGITTRTPTTPWPICSTISTAGITTRTPTTPWPICSTISTTCLTKATIAA